MTSQPSHPVAVTGYVYEGGRFLLLKRTTPPLIWAPPGGRLLSLEDPRVGVERELHEETGLSINAMGFVNYWFGTVPGHGPLLSLDFVILPNPGEVHLSSEHSEFLWCSIEDLQATPSLLGREPWSYPMASFIEAEKKVGGLLGGDGSDSNK